jgi:hypothetical protein
MWKNVSTLFLVSALLILYSCAVKRTELPDYQGMDVQEVLSSRNDISSIETTFAITFEKDDTEMRGDGALNLLKNGDLSMRIYSFGFLAFEMTAHNGIIKSNPPIDRTKGIILSSGLRDCLFWWDIKDFSVEEDESAYILKNMTRSLWINRETMLPIRQMISLEDGRELMIRYENPDYAGALWYPSKIRIELARYAVTLNIREISFLPGFQSEINRDRPDDRTFYDISFGQVAFKKGIVANGVDEPRGSVGEFEYTPYRIL